MESRVDYPLNVNRVVGSVGLVDPMKAGIVGRISRGWSCIGDVG